MRVRERLRRRVLAGLALGTLTLIAVADGPPVEVWTDTYDAGAGNDIGFAVALDSEGSVITVGYSHETLTGKTALGSNAFIRKLGYDGVLDWSKVLDNTTTDDDDSNSTDQFLAVCVDGDDNIIVGGDWSGSWSGGDGYHNVAWLEKYSNDGTLLWTWKGNSSYGAWSAVRGVQVDSAGNVYACGNTFTSWGPIRHQWAIWKFSPDGQLQTGYPIYHNESTSELITDLAYSIDVHSDGSFVVAGQIGTAVGNGTSTKDLDWHVRRYDANGDLMWHDTYRGDSNLYDVAFGVVFDEFGNAYVAGYTNTGTDNTDNHDWDALVMKYATNGVRTWTQQRVGAPGEAHLYRDVVLAGDGTLSAVGYHRDAGAMYNSALSEGLDPDDGHVFGGSIDSGPAHVLSLSVDAREDLYAVAGYLGETDAYDAFTVLGEFEADNAAPIVDESPAPATDLGAIGEQIPFSIAVHDPDDDPVTVTWDFGDGTFATGTNPTHAFATPGFHTVSLTISDGFENVFSQTGLDVGIPVEKPSVKAKLNFKKTDKDAVTFKCGLALTDQLLVEGQVVKVNIGGVEESFTLNKKGKATTTVGKVTFKYKRKKGQWLLTVALKKGDFAEDWEDEDLVDTTVKKAPRTIKCTIEYGEDIKCAHIVDVLYTAKAGKWGKTK